MCFMCDDTAEFERPTEAAMAAIPLIKAAIDAGEEWGALHIVLEDGNIEDECIMWCSDLENITAEGSACAAALLGLTCEQRETAIMLAHGRVIKYVDEASSTRHTIAEISAMDGQTDWDAVRSAGDYDGPDDDEPEVGQAEWVTVPPDHPAK